MLTKKIKTAVFPFTLPYHQPINAIRIFLDHLGSSRFELIDAFRTVRNRVNVLEPSLEGGAYSTDPITYNQNDFENKTLDDLYENFLQRAADAEYLELTPEEYFILTKESFVSREYWDTQYFVGGSHGIHMPAEYQAKIGILPVGKYYGYENDAEMLSLAEYNPALVEPEKSREKDTKKGLFFVKDQFLPRTGIDYADLLELLKTHYINPKIQQGGIIVIGDTISITDTCDLEAVRLHLGLPQFHAVRYDRIHRFIRLWRKLGWTIDEVDQSITSDITPDYLHQLVAIKKIADRTGLELTKLLCFWSNINTNGDNSLYKRLFLTHNLLAVDTVFQAVNGNYLSQTPRKLMSDHLPVLIAALNCSAEDIDSIINITGEIMPDELTLENVSKLYRYRLLSKVLGIKVPELTRLRPLFGDFFASPEATFSFLEKWRRMEEAGFNYSQLNYLVKDADDLKKPMTPDQKQILLLAKTLYDGLTKIDEDHQDLKANPLTTDPVIIEKEIQAQASSELVRSKASLYYDQDTVDKIMSVLEGTGIFSTTAPKNIKDLTKPIPPPDVIPVPPQEYENLKLENYPLLHGKVKYDAVMGSVQVRGILTVDEEAAFKGARKTAAANQLNANDENAWNDILKSITSQQNKLFNETFKGIFAAEAAFFISGDTNNIPIDPVSGADNNTAPKKRARFLQLFLPWLRKELAHRLIIDTVSNAGGLERRSADILITQVLQTGINPVSLYQVFEGLKYANTTGTTNTTWTGNLLPTLEEEYTFITRNFIATANLTKPNILVNGIPLVFTEQTDSPNEWWGTPLKLKAGKQYDFQVEGVNMDLKDLYWKTNATSPVQVPTTVLLPAFAKTDTAVAFSLFRKAVMLVNGFRLSADEIIWFNEHRADFGGLTFNAIDLNGFLRLENYTRLRNSLPAAKINILDFLNWANDTKSVVAELEQKIADVTNWKPERIAQLIAPKQFNLKDIAKFRNEENLLKLQKAMELADKIGLGIKMLFDCAIPVSAFEDCHNIAESIRKAIRSKYNQDDWEQVVKPLNDKLRENQKNALIAYLLVQPDIRKWGATDSGGLFEYFLIDVEMDVCMETSRIKQAISSVQLFVQRCFLGLEALKSGITPDVLDAERWEWMQRFRVWEANRKVFLYPENWIESNLRDDKTPFFKELESELLQKDINKQNIEDALKSYLYKLDEVANLEMIGVYIEGERTYDGWMPGSKLHVFGRTRNAPYFFYYRYFAFDEGNWYPWEKMQVDIPTYESEDGATHKTIGNGCYLVPVMWNSRLLIFFPQFMKKTRPADAPPNTSLTDMADKPAESGKPVEFWEIKMAWSEYRNKKWTQKQLSKNAIYHEGAGSLVNYPGAADMNKAIADAEKARLDNVAALNRLIQAQNDFINVSYIEYNYFAYLVMMGTKLINATTTQEKIDIANAMSPDAHQRYIHAAEQTLANAAQVVLNRLNELTSSRQTLDAANAAMESEIAKYNDAVKKAYIDHPLADISKFKFVPVFSNNNPADRLFGVKVFINDLEIGVFEFNGRHITDKTLTYLGGVVQQSTNFHHAKIYNDYIRSFQSMPFAAVRYDDEAENHIFIDETLSYYAFDGTTVQFHHPYTHDLIGKINTGDLPSFFTAFNEITNYEAKSSIYGFFYPLPAKPDSYHELKQPYSIYNWELLFHAPMMLADALSKSQQFEEAMKWYHFVFYPMAKGQGDKRFWQFVPFKELDSKQVLSKIFNALQPNQPDKDIREWRNNPFKPHLVARARPVAYMKWVVMKYIDNLIAWGDYLFRQDTIESINQASQLYIMAGHILGNRPQAIPKQTNPVPQTYNSLLTKWDAFSNAMAQLEVAKPINSGKIFSVNGGNGQAAVTSIYGTVSALYFCIPNNPTLIAYWDTIADRLFKIRHCENIEGIFRKLPLFEPPIDPALLVKAAAQGLSIGSVLNDLNTPMPNYRFYYLLQKAIELCGELKSLGSALLSALEKKDNEAISLLRARHESNMHSLVMEIKKQQLEEAGKNLDSLQQNRKGPEHRMKYYLQLIGEDAGKMPGSDNEFSEIANAIERPVDESGLKLIKYEKEDMDKAGAAHEMQKDIGQKELLASILHLVPTAAIDVKPFGIGVGIQFGGPFLGGAMQAWAKSLQNDANEKTYSSTSASKKGGFLRSMQDRVMQANAAGYEIKQIDKQILAQQIRINIANQEIVNQQKQIDNAEEVEDFLRNKYSNEELYAWTKDQLSTLYHQVYSMAFDLAKKAEKVYRFERGLTSSNFIQAGYWDAGYNGLLSGEQLFVGLKQLEAAYHENRGYDYEITKHVSLKQVSPLAIFQLRQSGSCEFVLPEVLFDMDYPGHYKRRIKSVSISVPCIAGPYTGVNGTLRLLENKFRNTPLTKNANEYPEKTGETDDRFQGFIIPINAIATSSGQNDSGMFELNFKDERYLPFEGAGVISKWRFELPSFKQFDYNTIADLIVHIKYTSVEGGERLKSSAEGSITHYMNSVEELGKNEGLFAVINIRHDMPDAWYKLTTQATVDLKITDPMLPYFAGLFPGKQIVSTLLIARLKDATRTTWSVKIPDGATPLELNKSINPDLLSGVVNDLSFNTSFQLSIEQTDIAMLEELVLLVKYGL